MYGPERTVVWQGSVGTLPTRGERSRGNATLLVIWECFRTAPESDLRDLRRRMQQKLDTEPLSDWIPMEQPFQRLKCFFHCRRGLSLFVW